MSGMHLPAGYTARPPTPADAESIVDLATAHSVQVIGIADYTLDDARDDLSEPGFDPERDAHLVFGPQGRLAGYARANREGDSNQVDVDVVAVEPVIARWLVAQVLVRAKQIGAEHGHPQVVVDHGVYRDDKLLRAELEAAGFEPATAFHRMRVDHHGPVQPPTPPPGVVLHTVGDDEPLRRAAHGVFTASFADHFGFVAPAYDSWREKHEKKSTFAWTQLWVAEVGGRAVGVLECGDQYVADENCGYVTELGVLAEARGRGIAKYLLLHAFAVDANNNRAGTMLHVDSNNTTPALGLYESVGMRPVLVIDAWRRTLAV